MGKKKKSEYTVAMFLELFNNVKASYGRKGTTKTISKGQNLNNFKARVEEGYTPEEFEQALHGMFTEKEPDGSAGWALRTGNDVPAHFLRSASFEKYLNLYVNGKAEAKKEEPKRPVINAPQKEYEPAKQAPAYTAIEIEESKQKYRDSLKAGKWLGNMGDAMRLIDFFSKSFTLTEKQAFFKEGEMIAAKQSETARYGAVDAMQVLDRMARSQPKFATYEVAIKEAVKRKIKEPWQTKTTSEQQGKTTKR